MGTAANGIGIGIGMIGIFKIYLQAWRETFRHWKMWTLLYFLNIAFALLIILPFRSYFEDIFGNSFTLEKLLQSFDFDIIGDLLNNYGKGLSFLTNLTPIVLVAYLLLNTFTMGGILNTFRSRKFQFSSFWSTGSQYFWRMLRLAFYFLLIQVLLLGIALILINILAEGFSLDALQSEVRIIQVLFWVGIPYILLAAILFMLHDYVKVHLLHHSDAWLTRPILGGIGFTFRNFLKTYPLYLLNVVIAFGVYALYKFFEIQLLTTSTIDVLILLIFGQLFIFFRIGAQLTTLASSTLAYQQMTR